MKSIFQIIFVVIISGGLSDVVAQKIDWRVQAPCVSDFSVELPAPLYEVSTFEGKHGPSLDAERGFDSFGPAFVALQKTPMERQFGIVVRNVSKKERKEFNLDLKHGDFGGLNFMIGGDDATPTNEKIVRVNGLVGKEYTYAKAIKPDTYTRGRIFFINNRLYFVIFVTTKAEDISSADAERFLNSFRLRKKKR
jgi:hypothetical protein